MNFKSQGSRPLPPVAIEMMPLKKPLFDSLLSSIHRFIDLSDLAARFLPLGWLACWLAGLLAC
jgi:hypothetical protein